MGSDNAVASLGSDGYLQPSRFPANAVSGRAHTSYTSC